MQKYILIVLTTLSLLGFSLITHADPTYDLTNKSLTLPKVTVGDTTYSNVVLKLNDFEVQHVDPNPLVGKVEGGFLIQFVSAVKKAKKITVTLLVTSQFQDRTINVGHYWLGYDRAYAKITDDKGNAYGLSTTQVGETLITNGGSNIDYIKFPFIADIPMQVTYTYDNFATNATSISVFDVAFSDDNYQTVASYQLRNITLQ